MCFRYFIGTSIYYKLIKVEPEGTKNCLILDPYAWQQFHQCSPPKQWPRHTAENHFQTGLHVPFTFTLS